VGIVSSSFSWSTFACSLPVLAYSVLINDLLVVSSVQLFR
jgi:hypothetical protein